MWAVDEKQGISLLWPYLYHLVWYITAKRLVVLTTEWLIADKLRRKKLILVLETNCIKPKNARIDWQPSKHLQLHFKNMMLLWWFSHRYSVVNICKTIGCYCRLFNTCRCDPHSEIFNGYYIYKIMVVRWSGNFLCGFLMHNSNVSSATRATTQWLQCGNLISILVLQLFALFATLL